MSERTGNVKILVSTCLVGINSQWNEGSAKVDDVVELVKSGKAVFLCPEQLGGLSTPRDPAEIEPGRTAKDVLEGNGRVLTPTGKDFTKQFVCGAQRLLAFCQEMGIETAILKAGSPSCGEVCARSSRSVIPRRFNAPVRWSTCARPVSSCMARWATIRRNPIAPVIARQNTIRYSVTATGVSPHAPFDE